MMAELTDADRAHDARVGNIPRVLEAMDRAVREALLQHKRAGNPVATWRDGQVVWIQPEDIPVEPDEQTPESRTATG
jgi:hypothetical protein